MGAAPCDLAGVLANCPDPAASLLLAGAPAVIQPNQVSAVEQFLIQNAPAGTCLDTLLGEVTGIPVIIADDPLSCVAIGTGLRVRL